MTTIPRITAALASLALGSVLAPAGAADLVAGADLAVQCAACHGAAGVSTSAAYPNIAAQKEAYLAAQLEAFRSRDRANPLMNAVAAQLTDADIENLAAHFAGLPGAEPGEVAESAAGLDGTLIEFPADFETTFTRYHRIDFEQRKQVRFYLANDAALEAVRAGGAFPAGAYLLVQIFGAEVDAQGNLVTGADGQYVPTELVGYTAMEKQEGAGDPVPELLRNDDWRYSNFSAEGERRADINEAPCLACHVPLTDTDFVFTHEALTDFAKSN